MRRIPYDLIVASSLNRGIGANGTLPWNLKPDLKMFKSITSSGSHTNALIMGRKTFESLNQALPSRLNIVISRNSTITESDNLKVVRSLDEGL